MSTLIEFHSLQDEYNSLILKKYSQKYAHFAFDVCNTADPLKPCSLRLGSLGIPGWGMGIWALSNS